VPVLRIHAQWRDNERALLKDMSITAAEMLSAAGAHEINPSSKITRPDLPFTNGNARMGRDPKTSVLNAHNQAHDAKNCLLRMAPAWLLRRV